MFYTCGPNEAMVVSGKTPYSSTVVLRYTFPAIWRAVQSGLNVHNTQEFHRCSTNNNGIMVQLTLCLKAVRGLSSLPGFCRSPPLMIAGGRVFVFPCIQQIQRLARLKDSCCLHHLIWHLVWLGDTDLKWKWTFQYHKCIFVYPSGSF